MMSSMNRSSLSTQICGEDDHPHRCLVDSTDVSRVIDLIGCGTGESEFVYCSGIVVARRAQKNVLFLSIDVLDINASNSTHPLRELEAEAKADQCSVQFVLQTASTCTSVLGDSTHLRKGSLVKCRGRAAVDKPGSLSVYVESFSLVRCSPDPTAITRLLEAIYSDVSPTNMADMHKVLFCSHPELETLLQLIGRSLADGVCGVGSIGGSEAEGKPLSLSRAVGMHSRVIAGCAARRSRRRDMHVKPADLEVLERSERSFASLLFPADPNIESHVDKDDASGCSSVCTDCGGEHLPAGAFDAPSARGPLSRGQYYHGKKMPQVEWIVDRLRKMHTHRRAVFTHYLDIGGGRGDLAFSIALTFPTCLVTLIDRNKKSLDQARERADALGLSSRMQFVCVTLVPEGAALSAQQDSCVEEGVTCSTAHLAEFLCRNPKPQEQSEGDPFAPVDCVVALHACGGLTDLALQCACASSCSFLVVPCCYVKFPVHSSQWACKPVSFSDVVSEDPQMPFLCTSDRSIVLSLAESTTREISCRASRVVNSERLLAAGTVIGDRNRLTVEYFPSSFSLRNAMLLCV